MDGYKSKSFKYMIKYFGTLILLFVVFWFMLNLIGCSPPKFQTLAYECPKLTLPELPALETQSLSAKSTHADIARAYVGDLAKRIGWDKIVIKQVNAFNGG